VGKIALTDIKWFLIMGIEKIDEAADISQLHNNRIITNLMFMIWQSRKDLQQAFDINTKSGQEGFINWYDLSVTREYGISITNEEASDCKVSDKDHNTTAGYSPLGQAYSYIFRFESKLSRASQCLPEFIRLRLKKIWLRSLSYAASLTANSSKNNQYPFSQFADPDILLPSNHFSGENGVSLIGYAHAELGMGEHVRMSAAALAETSVSFGVVNFDIGLPARHRASLDHGSLIESNRFKVNLFHINADQMLLTYCHLGKAFFENRYNIGYWAWELAKCPEDWKPILGLVDEVWAPSKFIQQAFSGITDLPVIHMPLCVSLPAFPKYSREYFSLPARTFLFVFAFDFFSYINRKNPFAAILAFKLAFPMDRTDVGLVIKVMNGDKKSSNWQRMMDLIDKDPRIFVLNQTMDRKEVLGLFDVCDCFISLHRSEGFGRGPAEAMLLGKPVIVTNYSGNIDFTLANNSCLVDFHLIPVESDQYIFSEDQVWADPDVEHAAWYMHKLVDEPDFYHKIGLAGSSYLKSNYNQSVIGNLYQKRLTELHLI
jgi:glycosyltransferase involved in cell wall biosynthesis